MALSHVQEKVGVPTKDFIRSTNCHRLSQLVTGGNSSCPPKGPAGRKGPGRLGRTQRAGPLGRAKALRTRPKRPTLLAGPFEPGPFGTGSKAPGLRAQSPLGRAQTPSGRGLRPGPFWAQAQSGWGPEQKCLCSGTNVCVQDANMFRIQTQTTHKTQTCVFRTPNTTVFDNSAKGVQEPVRQMQEW